MYVNKEGKQRNENCLENIKFSIVLDDRKNGFLLWISTLIEI